MRNIFLGIVSACILAPSIASAALTLTIPRVDVRPGDSGALEVFFTETGGTPDENLVAYSVGLNMGGQPGVSFIPPPVAPTGRPFVFPAGTPVDDTGSNASRVRSLSALPSGDADITNGAGVLRIPFTVAQGAALGERPVTFELQGGLTEFSDDIGGIIEFTPVNGAINVIPEPAALGLLGIGGVLFLRRRRA